VVLHRVLVSTIVAAAVASCSSDDAGRGETSDASRESVVTSAVSATTTTTVEPVAVSSRDICELVPLDRVGSALGVVVSTAEPSSEGPPTCRYDSAAGDVVQISVLRTREDLGGGAGPAAWETAVEIARDLADAPPPGEEVFGIGSSARWFDGAVSNVLVAHEGGQVGVVTGPSLTQEQAGGLAAMLLSGVAQQR
jgi:hypothetical protein